MTSRPLAPEVISPPDHRVPLGVALALSLGMTGAAIVVGESAVTIAPVPPAPVEQIAPSPAIAMAAPARVARDEVKLAFRAGGATYVKLASLRAEPGLDHEAGDAALAMPAHGPAVLVGGTDEDWVVSAIAAVELADVPAAYRGWRDRTLTIGGLCRANVTGFAVVARLTGDTSYASEDGEGDWTPDTVMKRGARMLVAKLDGNCHGRIARDAALPPIVLPAIAATPDAALVAAARQRLIASLLGREAAAQWKEMGMAGAWFEGEQGATFQTLVVRHPKTGATFVSVHAATPFECGGANVNAWGLYRVTTAGALERVVERELGIVKIDQIVDLEGDGTLELVGEPLFDEAAIERTDGTVVEQLERPFYGCAC